MNDLDSIRAYRADAPTPTADAIDAAWQRVVASDRPTRAAPRNLSKERRRTPTLIAAAFVCGAVMLVLVNPFSSARDGSPIGLDQAVARDCTSSAATAVSCMTTIARVAGAQASIATGKAYTEQRIDYGNIGQTFSPALVDKGLIPGIAPGSVKHAFTAYQDRRIEIWIAPDQTAYEVATGISVVWPTPADKAAWRADGEPSLAEWLKMSGQWATFTQPPTARELFLADETQLGWLDPGHLPQGPDALLHSLRQVAASELPGTPGSKDCAELLVSCPATTRGIINRYVLGKLITLLRFPLTHPRDRSTIFRAVSLLRGARLVGSVEEPSGRTGIGVLLVHNPDMNLLVFDPRSADLIAAGHLAIEDQRHVKQTRWYSSFRIAPRTAIRVPDRVKNAPQWCCQ